MAESVRKGATVRRLVVEFLFFLVLAFALLVIVRLAGFLWVLVLLIPVLVLVIYLLPGHGERTP